MSNPREASELQRYTVREMANEHALSVGEVVTLAHILRDERVRNASDVLAESTVRQLKGAFSLRRSSILRGRYEALATAQTRRKLTRSENAELKALENVFYPACPRSRSRSKQRKSQPGSDGRAVETSKRTPRRVTRNRGGSEIQVSMPLGLLAEEVGLPTPYILNLANCLGAQLKKHTDVVPDSVAALIRNRHSHASSGRMRMQYLQYLEQEAVSPLTGTDLEKLCQLKEIFEPPAGALETPVDENGAHLSATGPRSERSGMSDPGALAERHRRPGIEYDIQPWHRGSEYLMGHPGSGRRR